MLTQVAATNHGSLWTSSQCDHYARQCRGHHLCASWQSLTRAVDVDSLKDELYGFSISLKQGMLGYLCRPGLASHHAYTYLHTQYPLAVSAPQGQLVRVIDRRLKLLSGKVTKISSTGAPEVYTTPQARRLESYHCDMPAWNAQRADAAHHVEANGKLPASTDEACGRDSDSLAKGSS